MIDACPGAVDFTDPKPMFVKCECGREVEIWTDEISAECECGRTVKRDMKSACYLWCEHAAECIGEENLRRIKDGKSE
ncbi:MAG: hypothetical protein ACXQTJ_01420 [Candidatus Syntropharchaeales archaeon]|nr:hypothetical protein [Candidatus Syntrophoarchaeum sp.]